MQEKKTLADYFSEHASDLKFVHEIETGKKKNHALMLDCAKQMSSCKQINKNDVVTVILPNSIQYIECFLAAMFGGWIFNPLPYFIQTQELEKIFEYVKPSIIITDKNEIFSHFIKKYKILTPEQTLLENKKFEKKEIDSMSPAALYYSSGTTGNPKGVLYSHKNMITLISSIVRGFKFTSQDHQLAFLPFGHTASINYNILPSILIGCDLFISKGFEHLRNNFFNVLEKYKITYTEIVPTVLFVLNKLKADVKNINLSSLEFIGCSSSTLPLSAQKEFIKQYGIGIGNLYGLSETGPTHIDDPREKGWAPGSVGVPLDVNKCKISEDGEILIKGENVFIGYYKNKELYKNIVINGWFHTGDLGEYRNGKFYFTDRKKDIIIKGAINIVPMEIEEVIHEHPEVLECVVVGKRDNIHGEDVAAVVVKNGDIDDKKFAKEIKSLCQSRFSSYKVPNHIEFWNSIPKTLSKKPLRRKVRELINKT
jgi:acyl-coenzyme A synthetase/AMP-(fatty) acid ligase